MWSETGDRYCRFSLMRTIFLKKYNFRRSRACLVGAKTMGSSRRKRLMQGEIGTIEAKWLQGLMKVSLGNALAEAGGPRLANGHTIPRLRLVAEIVVITE
jgi:hypothetical protein